jgi:uncharacterized protein YqgC (DUF456 family)
VVETILLLTGGLLVIAGIAGCMLPFLPGPPLSYLGLIILQLSSRHPFTTNFLLIFGVITLMVLMLDFIIPVYSTKKFHGSKYGVRGSIIGLIAGFIFFPPFGIIIGPAIGAFLGEIFSGKKAAMAVRSAVASLAGFLAGTMIKLTLSVLMSYHFFSNLY